MIKTDDLTHRFTINDKQNIELFLGDNTIEIYDTENPANSGFVFNSFNDLIYFCNCITDIIEEKQKDK